MMERFNFFVPTQIIKGKKGEQDVFRFEGLASDGTRDSDGETMRDTIFEIDDRFIVNWDHQGGPENIIGIVTEWDAKKGYLFVKGELYPEIPRAKATIDLMSAFEKSSRMKLGISIEGRVLERDLIDRSKIKKAQVTAIALCPHPKNSNTWADVCKKSLTSEDLYIDPKNYEYEPQDDTFIQFVSEIGSMIIKKSGEVEVNLNNLESKFIILCKAHQNDMLGETDKITFEKFYQKYKNFLMI